MSDGISHARHQEHLWNKARKLTCMYFGKIPYEDGVTKEYIENWLMESGRTPEQMKKELEKLDLMWWLRGMY